ncbi:MAG: hypothetical protein ACREAA_01820 [Candidatus Polarisedimenticolia bacterium]
MKLTLIAPRTLLCALLISAGAITTAYTAQTPEEERSGRTMECEMKFSLKGMSAFSETAKGEGIITCNNGQMAKLSIRATGGGFMFGASEVVDGSGQFSDARTIDELFGSYVQAEVYARTGRSAAAHVLTKGRISLVLVGTGRGVDFGLAFDKLTIDRANETPFSRY